MDSDVRENLPVIVAMTLIGIATCAFGLGQVHANAGGMTLDAFNWFIILIPCIVMIVMSFAIMVVAQRIGRQLFLVVMVICLITGIVAMVITSSWLSDDSIAAQLLANSPEGTVVVPVLQAPVIILRDIAAFVVCPTVGSIAGAWVGSRLHPLESSKQGRGKKPSKSKKAKNS